MSDSNVRPSSSWLRWLPLVVLVLAVAGFLGWQWLGGTRDDGEAAPRSSDPATEPPAATEPGASSALTPLEKSWQEATGRDPVWPENFDRPTDCAAVIADLRATCERLDTRPAIADRVAAQGGSLALLTGAALDLEQRLPVVEGELARHEAVLANVSHLFRVLGERRVRVLLDVVGEDDLLEPVALDLFRWARVRERCEEMETPLGPGFEAQYEYASFLIQTVGGQAYLRRRAPRVEALATFYALLVLDDAVDRGHNPHGVDLRRETVRVRQLLEGAGDLVFRDRYLEIVREMERRWRTRSSLVPVAPPSR